MTARCFFCGAPAAEGEDPHNALCADHQAIHCHVVSLTRAGDGSIHVATCKGCGWSHRGDSFTRREEAIEAHWESVCDRPIPANRGRQEMTK
jgi:hypothetical protein